MDDKSGRITYESAHDVYVYTFKADGRDYILGPMKLQFTIPCAGLIEIEETRSQEGFWSREQENVLIFGRTDVVKRPFNECLSTQDFKDVG